MFREKKISLPPIDNPSLNNKSQSHERQRKASQGTPRASRKSSLTSQPPSGRKVSAHAQYFYGNQAFAASSLPLETKRTVGRPSLSSSMQPLTYMNSLPDQRKISQGTEIAQRDQRIRKDMRRVSVKQNKVRKASCHSDKTGIPSKNPKPRHKNSCCEHQTTNQMEEEFGCIQGKGEEDYSGDLEKFGVGATAGADAYDPVWNPATRVSSIDPNTGQPRPGHRISQIDRIATDSKEMQYMISLLDKQLVVHDINNDIADDLDDDDDDDDDDENDDDEGDTVSTISSEMLNGLTPPPQYVKDYGKHLERFPTKSSCANEGSADDRRRASFKPKRCWCNRCQIMYRMHKESDNSLGLWGDYPCHQF